MKELKDYKMMTPEEQLKWLTDFTTFSKQKLPALAQLGDAWTAAHYKVFEEGLTLLSAFSMCRGFIDDSLLFRDFSRRLSTMEYLVERIRQQISKGFVMKGVDGEQVVYVPTAVHSKRRGRPTKEEAAAAAAQSEENKMEEERARTIALLNDAVPMEKSVEREKNNEELLEEKRKAAAQTPSLFGEMAQMEEKTSPVDLLIAENRPHLDQIAFLLTAGTAAEVGQLREIRVSLSAAAERAKLLAEQGANPEVVAPHSKKAADLTQRVENIYLKVDRELARLYVLMPMDKTLDGHSEEAAKRNLGESALLTILKPYYQKVKAEDNNFDADVIAEFEASRPEVVAARKAEEARKEEVAALRKYILRTDKKASKKRIEGIRERIARLEELGEDVSAMNLVLAKTEEDFEKEQNK